ncbi:MAG: PEGA domain-containing protein [Spirochaetes bacterium]|nr:PEGA domain-containing protein [Spirochaetota bacterium]
MKKARLFIILLLCCAAPAFADFNPFTQKRIVIGSFKNNGDPQYDYLGLILENSIYEYALFIPFLTLTDRERASLLGIAGDEKYAAAYEEAGGRLGFRLLPVVERGEADAAVAPGSVFIGGGYEVSQDEAVILSIEAIHGTDKSTYAHHEAASSLYDIVYRPETYLVDFFKKFLRYKTHLVRFIVEPEDSLLFIDGTLLGIGSKEGVLLTPGAHRVRVSKNGFKSFDHLVQVREDRITIHAALQREETKEPFFFPVSQDGARIYAGARYLGTSPDSVTVSESDRTVTFIKEGYINRTVTVKEIEEKPAYEIPLLSGEMKTSVIEQALRHKNGSETLYYTGLGMTGLSILFGIGKTAYQQQADLYKSSNEARHSESLQAADTLGYLTAASVTVTAGVFIFAFIEMLKYFDLYYEGQYDLIRGEVRF